MVHLRLLAENGNSMLQVRSLDVRHHSPAEPADEACLQAGDLGRRPVTRENDLPAGFVQRIEGVEELFLRGLLTLEEVHVVHEQQVDLPVAALELLLRAALDCRDQVVRELLGANEGDSRLRPEQLDFVSDGLHEVRLAQPRVAVNEQRVVEAPGGLRYGMRRCISQLVRLSNNEVVEGVALVERGGRIAARERSCDGGLVGGWSDEQVHLLSGFPFLVNAEDDANGMPECNGCVAGYEVSVLGFVPVCSELVGSANHECIPFNEKGFGRFEPGAEGLFRYVLAGAIEQTGPDFDDRETHRVYANDN